MATKRTRVERDAQKQQRTRDNAIRRFDEIGVELLALRRTGLRRDLTATEAARIANFDSERNKLRRDHPTIAFGLDSPSASAAPREASRRSGKRDAQKKAKKKAKAKKETPYIHDNSPAALKTPRRRYGREIYAVGRIQVVGGGLPEKSRRKH